MIEPIQFTYYNSVEKGLYKCHTDGQFWNLPHNRKFSIVMQLSDPSEYEGGDLELWFGGNAPIQGPRGKGVGVLFPSYAMHRVTPITKGLRKSLVLWVGGSHYK